MNDLKTIRQLVKLMVDNDLTEVDLEQEGEKIRLKRRTGAPEVQYVAAPTAAAPPAAPAPSAEPASADAPPAAKAEADADAGLVPIPSPMVGTFYSAPSPDADPYIKPGDSVSRDSVVCIIEAMKVFNEIKAEASGTVQKILVESGQSVEFGQPLFLIKPSA